jgi:hypothetical protein
MINLHDIPRERPRAGSRLQGRDGAIYIEGHDRPVATLNDWQLNWRNTTMDATVFGDTNRTYLVNFTADNNTTFTYNWHYNEF